MFLPRTHKRTGTFILASLAIISIAASVFLSTTRKVESKSESPSSLSHLGDRVLRRDRMKQPSATASSAPLSPPAFLPINVDRTDDVAAASLCTPLPNDCSLRGATKFANTVPGTTINLPAGTYQLTADGSSEIGFCLDENLGDLNIAGNNTSIVGAGAATTIIQQTTPHDRVLCVDANLVGNFNFSISGVTISGGRETNGVGGGGIISGGFGDVTNVTDCIITNNQTSGNGSPVGGGVGNAAGTLNVSGTTISGNTARASGGGIYSDALGGGSLTITNSSFQGNSSTLGNGGGLLATGSLASTMTVTSNSFSGNTTGGGNGAGGGLFKQTGSMSATLNSFSNNTASGGSSRGGGIANGSGLMNANYNRIVGNTASNGSGASNNTGTLNANDNWWGCSSGPSGATGVGCTVSPNGVFGTIPVSWLQLRHSAGDTDLCANESTTLTADIKGRNISGPLTVELNGLVAFPTPPGTIFSNATFGTLSGASTQFVNGVATATFTAGVATGLGGADATADNQTEHASVSVQNTTTTDPADQTVCQGTDATFSTTASGGTDFQYAWTLDGNTFGGNTSSITIPTGSLSAGSHTVTVTTTAANCGAATQEATLTVQAATSATDLESQTVCQGTPASFSTTATGDNLHYSWTVDGSSFGGDTSSISVATGALSAGGHPVTVTVTGSCGTVTKNATLTVQASTTATDVADQTVCKGATASFSTTATGENLQYAWTVDGAAFGGNTSSISVPTGSVSPGNHPVTVTVTGSCGTVVKNATLTVQQNTAATTPADQTVCQGAPATFSTTATGDNLHYAWTLDGVGFGGDTSSITVATGSLSFGGHPVTVTVSGSCGNVVRNATLTVQENTTASTPADQTVCQGATANFSTTASGENLQYAWTVDGNAFGGNTSSISVPTGSLSTGSHPVTVTVSGSCGTVVRNATLNVNANVATTDPADVSTCEGQTVNFSTTASGTGPFSFVWKQGATVLANGSLGGRVTITNTATTSTLTIANVQPGDSGIYNVETTGSCGTATQSATLAAGAGAPTITLKNVDISLWPPNHQYRTINVTDLVQSASDSCDAGVNINSVKILQITSDELDENPNGGDGNTTNDIVIAANCKSAQLRAERDGNLNGRVYTITFIVTDVFGHSTTATAKVTVPHSQNGVPAVDSGVQNTVNGNCP